jgi:hypothetical protein
MKLAAKLVGDSYAWLDPLPGATIDRPAVGTAVVGVVAAVVGVVAAVVGGVDEVCPAVDAVVVLVDAVEFDARLVVAVVVAGPLTLGPGLRVDGVLPAVVGLPLRSGLAFEFGPEGRVVLDTGPAD